MPIVRECFLLAGFRDASRKVADRTLDEGYSIFLNPGGIAEALLPERGTDRVVAAGQRRQGLARMALKHRAPLVPVYIFGQNDTYKTNMACLSLRNWICRKMQVCAVPFWGRFFTGMPFAVNLTVAIGRSVPLPLYEEAYDRKSGDIRQEAVENYQRAFLSALHELFEHHKAEAGYPPERRLEILDADHVV